MCGIIGYTGNKGAAGILVEGLKGLEYRGYDSAGIAVEGKSRINIIKCKGKIKDLECLLEEKHPKGHCGLGHTRWATHGKPSKTNAHPHTDCSKKIVIVHNGIIENYQDLKKDLEKKGCEFKSETDTEVIVHLISEFYKGDLKEALNKALSKIKGSYALGVMSADEPGKIIAARSASPLIVGLGENENFIASDTSAILSHTRKVIYLEDGQLAQITKDNVELFDLKGKAASKKIDTVTHSADAAKKGGFPHFMLKEIYEQPHVLSRILSHYLKKTGKIQFERFNIKNRLLRKTKNIIILACGTAYHAGLVAKYALEQLTRIPVWVDVGSEFRYRRPIIRKNTLVIAISQSGETADTLAAVKEAKKSAAQVISVCNVLGSSLTRESDSVIYTHGGPEISVASTKAYTAQLMVLYLLGLYIAGLKSSLSPSAIQQALSALKKIPHQQKIILESARNIKRIAKKHLHLGAFLYLGRNINYPTALEGALKLKEISYIPAEGYASGEMKHGPIALIDEYRAVVCVANDSFVFDKMVSNIQEILARKGKVIAVASLGNSRIKDYIKEVIYIPRIKDIFSPLLTIMPLQLLAYYMAVLKDFDVDKPRNLAKSVTVE